MKFLEKGFQLSELEDAIKCADVSETICWPLELGIRMTLKFALLTTYSNQHFSIKKIMSKHWGVLHNDRILGLHLPKKPCVMFREVPPLRLQVSPNIIEPPKKTCVFSEYGGLLAL